MDKESKEAQALFDFGVALTSLVLEEENAENIPKLVNTVIRVFKEAAKLRLNG